MNSSTSVIELPSLQPGDYSVLVDGPPSGTLSGRFRLRITLSEPVPPPTNDTCASALELLPPGGTGTLTVQGGTTLAITEAVTSCTCTPASRKMPRNRRTLSRY